MEKPVLTSGEHLFPFVDRPSAALGEPEEGSERAGGLGRVRRGRAQPGAWRHRDREDAVVLDDGMLLDNGWYDALLKDNCRLIGSPCQNWVSERLNAAEHVHDEYNSQMEEAHQHLIWSHQGMDTWYRNSEGRIVTNSPWRLIDYWHITRRADFDDYLTELARGPN